VECRTHGTAPMRSRRNPVECSICRLLYDSVCSHTVLSSGTMTNDDDLKVIWKESVVAYSGYYPVICLEDVTNTSKPSVRVSDVPAETRTEHLQN
jgi:hypothetical protein